ncbi:T-cell-specific surface glycoprotein CD28-like isoform 2-T2 [Polymixia lowei]
MPSKVSIPCPPIKTKPSDWLKYHLFLNSSLIHTLSLKKGNWSTKGDWFYSGEGAGHIVGQAYENGVYSCKVEVFYPPPNREECPTSVVAVLKESNQSVLQDSQSCSEDLLSLLEYLLLAGCGILLVYSLAITCITICIWRKLKREEESESEYANTRPGEFRRPNKVYQPSNNYNTDSKV